MLAKPYRIHVSDAALGDLRRRLARARWPNEPAEGGWRFGSELAYMQKLIAHWREVYDWRAHEARLNAFPHHTVEIDGLRIHYIHEPGSGAVPRPLLLTHGWPSSFIEFLDVVQPLAHPERFGGDTADAFDVVVASLPGYGFSAAPPRPIGARAIAGLWHKLMTRVLGYRHFIAHGGDWGSLVTSCLALDHPGVLDGIHLTMLPLRPWRGAGAPPLSEDERAYVAGMRAWWQEQRGYQLVQATKPQTLAFALTDSPVGLAGWLVEKFRTLADTRGSLERRFSKDQLCTMLSLYWFTGCINPANWMYWAAREEATAQLGPGRKVAVPTGYADYPVDSAPRPPRSWGMRMYDIVHWSVMPAGGHFAAMEEPEAFVADLRSFVRRL